MAADPGALTDVIHNNAAYVREPRAHLTKTCVLKAAVRFVAMHCNLPDLEYSLGSSGIDANPPPTAKYDVQTSTITATTVALETWDGPSYKIAALVEPGGPASSQCCTCHPQPPTPSGLRQSWLGRPCPTEFCRRRSGDSHRPSSSAWSDARCERVRNTSQGCPRITPNLPWRTEAAAEWGASKTDGTPARGRGIGDWGEGELGPIAESRIDV